MEDQYGMSDLRQFISGRPLYPNHLHPHPDLLSAHHPYDMMAVLRDSANHTNTLTSASANNNNNSSNNNNNNNRHIGGSSSGAGFGGGGFHEMEVGGCTAVASGGGGRWPRQETLNLLEIRSRLDPKFKEANQKGPLWDEVSRIMSEEHGYQRSGKKCREKFENLYKYYKKTKDGKAGRQDGKHYRFFRQLEALYGETNNSASASEAHHVNGGFGYNYPNTSSMPNYNHQESFPGSKLSDTSLSLSNFSEYETTSSDDSDQNEEGYGNEADKNKKKRSKRGWKIKIKDFIDGQMRKLMEKQELWMEKIMNTIEAKEQERISREEEWRKQDAARIEMEHKFWASERAWIEARDSALMGAFHKMTENRSMSQNTSDENQAKWEMIMNNYVVKCNNKKRNHDESSICNPGGSSGGGAYGEHGTTDHSTIMRLNDHHGNSNEHGVDDPTFIRLNNDQANPNHNGGNAMSESCFRYFMGDPYGRMMD